MTVAIEELQVEAVETRGIEDLMSRPPDMPRPPDMDRIRLELRRDSARMQRLWAD